MTLDRNQENFETFMHRRIWGIGTVLIPLENSLPYVDNEYKNSCTHLHHFLTSVCEDMYENIDMYGFDPNGIPEFSRDGLLLRKKPEFPFWFLIKLADGSEIDQNGNLVLSTTEYKKVAKNFDQYLIDLLGRHGLVINSLPDLTVISNIQYPDMFRIILHMHKNNYKYNIMSCEFRIFQKMNLNAFTLTIETLGDEQKATAVEVDRYLCSTGLKRDKNLTIGKILYRHNKIIVAYMYREDNRLIVPIIFFDYRNNMPFEELCEKIDSIDSYENKEELKEFALEHQKMCTYCPTLNCNFYLSYKDKTVKVCRQRGGVYFYNFDEKNMDYLKQLVDIKMDYINHAK